MEQQNGSRTSFPDLNTSCLFVDSLFSLNEVVIQVSALSVILVFSLVGNVLVIYVVLRNKRSRNNHSNDVFLMNMAISDIVVPLMVLPKEIIVYYTNKETWPFDGVWGDFSCKMYAFLENLSPSVTVLTLIQMSIDRFCAIVFPTKINLISEKTRNYMVISTWIIGVGTSSTYLFTMNVEYNPQGYNECIFEWPNRSSKDSNDIFMTFNLIFYFVVPLLLLIILYTLILAKLKARNRVHSSRMARKRIQITKRVTIMTICVVGIFLFFLGPYYTVMSLLAFYWKWSPPQICSWPIVMLTVRFLVLSYSAVNPYICVCLIENHRRKITKGLAEAARSLASSALSMKTIFGTAKSFSLNNIDRKSSSQEIRATVK